MTICTEAVKSRFSLEMSPKCFARLAEGLWLFFMLIFDYETKNAHKKRGQPLPLSFFACRINSLCTKDSFLSSNKLAQITL